MNKNIKIFGVLLNIWLITGCTLDKIEDSTSGCPTPPKAEFTTDKTTGAPPLSVTFTNTSTNATTYKWDFGNTQTSTAEEPGARQYTIAGNYTVRLIANSGSGCSDTIEKVIMVVDPLAQVKACAQVTAQTNNGAAPSVVSFSAACSANATSFAWDFGDAASGASNTSTNMSTSHAYSTAGIFNVKLTASGSSGTKDTTIIVTISSAPIAAFTITNGGCIVPCEVTFTNTSSNATSFEWDFGDGSAVSSQFSPVHTYETAGDFIVKLTAINAQSMNIETKPIQVVEPKLTKTFGGTGNDYGFSVQQTSDGGYIALGFTNSTGAGQDDIYLVRTDNNMNVLWEKTYGGIKWDHGYSVQQTSDGGFILLGDTDSEGAGSRDLLLIRTDGAGNQQWKTTFGGVNYEIGNSVQQTNDGGFIVLGASSSEGAGNFDMYLIKTDFSGNLQWKKTFGGTNDDYGLSVQQTTDGGYILLGKTESLGAGSEDMYLVKTDVAGNKLWEKTFGGAGQDNGYSVQQTDDGGYILLGNTLVVSWWDIRLIKTDNVGNKIWEKNFQGADDDFGRAVQQTADGGYILLGDTRSQGAGSNDIYLIKTDNTGTLVWEKTFGGIGEDRGQSVKKTSDNGFIIVGYTDSDGAGARDLYLIKTDKDGNAQ